MIVDCVSDLHGNYPKLEGGDLLIVAGDLVARNEKIQYAEFADWFLSQNYKKRVLIAGNHDMLIENGEYYFNHEWLGYLQDSGTEFEGLKIWGSPWSLRFKGINPHCKAFTGSENDLLKKYQLIPNDVDILVTHSPPHGILDELEGGRGCAGSMALESVIKRVRPILSVFGHIHESYGIRRDIFEVFCGEREIIYVNASNVNERYEPINKPIRVIL